MKCIFELNSRAKETESAEYKHNKLISFLKTLDVPWGLAKDIAIPFPGFGVEFTATANISKHLLNGIKMSAFYRYRNMLENDQSSDDRIYIEFETRKVDFQFLAETIFPKFVTAFDAYTADIFDSQLIFKNHEEKRFGNRRKIINRVYPISYFDEILCETFFKCSPKKIAARLHGQVYKAEVFNKGIMIIADTKPYTLIESVAFENLIKSILRY